MFASRIRCLHFQWPARAGMSGDKGIWRRTHAFPETRGRGVRSVSPEIRVLEASGRLARRRG
jgi:hypothetical protein